MIGRDLHRVGLVEQRLLRIRVFREEYRLRSEQVTEGGHAVHSACRTDMPTRLAVEFHMFRLSEGY
ncbi:hypothetical protein GCM10027088_26540 [Nocardia goodfellowii]